MLKARRSEAGAQAPFAPAPIDEVVATIRARAPGVVFAPHVETASGMILPDDYLKAVGDAVHEVGGLFVLDCIASRRDLGRHAAPAASTCWSARRKRAGAARPAAPS